MTLGIKPVITVSVTKKPNDRLILNYTRPEIPQPMEDSRSEWLPMASAAAIQKSK